MRSRNVKPGFFKNEGLVELPFEYRLLFIGLWTMADRDGRMEDRPKRIKMELFSADDVDVNTGLQVLYQGGFIHRYEIEGRRFISIPKWHRHQNPHIKEAVSTIPAPCDPRARTVPVSEIPARAGLIPDSFNLIPDSLPLIPDSLNLIPGKPTSLARLASSEIESIYDLYPRKVAKRAALKAIKAAILRVMGGEYRGDKFPMDRAIAGIRDRTIRFRDSSAGQRGTMTPHPATWFNRSSYLDDPKEWVENDTGTSKAHQRIQRNRETLLADAARLHHEEAGRSGDSVPDGDSAGGTALVAEAAGRRKA